MEARERDFQRFVKHLGESHEGVISASNWLNSLGYSVTIPPSTVSDSYENRMNHVDKGDLYINMRVEVKRLGIDFTSKAEEIIKWANEYLGIDVAPPDKQLEIL